jgi:hypothetical protein
MTNEITKTTHINLSPTNMSDAIRFSEMLANSTMVPKDFIGKPGNIMVAIIMGYEVGLQPMQAIQNIAVINGRPSIWGDAMLGLIQSHPECEDVIEEFDEKTWVAVCTIKRRGRTPTVRQFTQEDAKRAKLWGKTGPWIEYPQRMIRLRARSWACRDSFPDALRGLRCAEEERDTVIVADEVSTADKIKRLKELSEIKSLQENKELATAENTTSPTLSDIDAVLARLKTVGYELSDKESSRLSAASSDDDLAKALAYFRKKLSAMEPPEDELKNS